MLKVVLVDDRSGCRNQDASDPAVSADDCWGCWLWLYGVPGVIDAVLPYIGTGAVGSESDRAEKASDTPMRR
jgi:hypothetical protein